MQSLQFEVLYNVLLHCLNFLNIRYCLIYCPIKASLLITLVNFSASINKSISLQDSPM